LSALGGELTLALAPRNPAPIPVICGGIIEPLEAIDPMAAIACSAEYGS
jgi:hypothetical protein